MGFLGPLPEEEVSLALGVRQLGLQPALVAFSQRAARYAVVSGEASGHMARTITTWRRTLPVPKTAPVSCVFFFYGRLKRIKTNPRAKAPMGPRIRPVVEAVLGSGVADGLAGNRGRERGLARSRRLPHNYKYTRVKTILPKRRLPFENPFSLVPNDGRYHVTAVFWCH